MSGPEEVAPATESLGVYVHVPFCTSRCDYCAFATWTDRFDLADAYVAAGAADARRWRHGLDAGGHDRRAPVRPATSVFFGGGTPSLLSPVQLAAILDEIPRAPGAEVTVECNPETVDPAQLAGYAAAGVTRLSFGVQSTVPHVLGALGRHHDAATVVGAVRAAVAAGLGERYSVDLIYGAAGETVADWRASLETVLALDPPPGHVSAYALTVEPGTPLARVPDRHPDPDDQADKYLITEELLGAAGLRWYEISNWARPGEECRHNRLYWAQGEYQGFGGAAHSHALDRGPGGGSRRWWNVRTPERYIRLVESGGLPVAAGEDLTRADRMVEAAQLGLRTRDGIDPSHLPGWTDDPDLVDLVTPSGPRLVLTLRGRLLANEVMRRVVAPTG